MRRRFTRLSAALVALALALAGLGWGLDRLYPPDMSRFEARSTVVLDREGALLRAFPTAQDTWRFALTPGEVDPLFLALLKEVEDGRFEHHPGVDPLAAARALGQFLHEGRIVSGASTLDMQAARLLSPRARTLKAKLAEMARALQLRARLGRQGVLSVYLTLAPYGGVLEGTRAASLAWFGKEPARLTPAEAALLVALPQSPERLRPDRYPEAARAARDRVLERAVNGGLLAPDVARAAREEPVPRYMRPLPRYAPHLAQRLAQRAPPGSTVRASVSLPLQRQLEALGAAERGSLAPGQDLAILVLTHRDRRLLAHLGSGDWERMQVDLSEAWRSPGSTLKPFIYALAFDDLSLHPQTLISDTPRRFGAWTPENFDHGFHGWVTARDALQRSLNVPAVQVLERVGPARMSALLSQCGVPLLFPRGAEQGLPLALGGVGVRLRDLALLYAALADGGRVKPLRETVDASDLPDEKGCVLVGEAAARAVIDILEGSPVPSGVVRRRAVEGGRAIAFKTGTSFGHRDAWTVGVSRDYTVAVWVGRPEGGGTPGALGLNTAAPVMLRVFDLLPPDREARPSVAGDHALLRHRPPPALLRLDAWEDAGVRRDRLRILFPPDGATVEVISDGVSLSAEGGRAPLQWMVDGVPLPGDARFWQPAGDGFVQLVVLDADGQRARVRIRVVGAEGEGANTPH
mgnify:CR=1 FL=1